MVTYLDISLFDSPAQTLVNTVNTVGVMGKGIAAEFKLLYPEMFNEYRRLCLENKLRIGMLYIYRTPNKIVVNFPTKKHWRERSRVSYIEAGLQKFVKHYGDYGISSVSFPQLGCGHGELSWEQQVQPIMERYLHHLPIPVYVHIYQRPADFVPERLDSEFAMQVRVERQQISANQLWEDLRNSLNESNGRAFQMSLFGPATRMDDEHIVFFPPTSEPIVVFREDIDDLWHTLRLRGTLEERDVPEAMREAGAVRWLFDLLAQLEYVEHVTIRGRLTAPNHGLRYVPRPNMDAVSSTEIVI